MHYETFFTFQSKAWNSNLEYYLFQVATATIGPLTCYPKDSQWNMFEQVVENGEKIDAIEKQSVQNNQILVDKIDDVLEDVASQKTAFDSKIQELQGT